MSKLGKLNSWPCCWSRSAGGSSKKCAGDSGYAQSTLPTAPATSCRQVQRNAASCAPQSLVSTATRQVVSVPKTLATNNYTERLSFQASHKESLVVAPKYAQVTRLSGCLGAACHAAVTAAAEPAVGPERRMPQQPPRGARVSKTAHKKNLGPCVCSRQCGDRCVHGRRRGR